MTNPVAARKVLRHPGGEETDLVAAEEPLELRLGEVPIAVLMRTPGADADLARGFCLTEAILLRPSELAGVEALRAPDGNVDPNRLRLVLAAGVSVDPEQFRRNQYTSSSCGVCGKASIDAVRIVSPAPPAGPRLHPRLLLDLVPRLAAAQKVFAATGGLHAAGLFDAAGRLLFVREDVGRHNAVDKAIGAFAAEVWPPGEVILAVSGRISFEVVQKAAAVGIPVVAGVSAPTSLAIDIADELGLTLIGFLREHTFNVYAGAGRLTG